MFEDLLIFYDISDDDERKELVGKLESMQLGAQVAELTCLKMYEAEVDAFPIIISLVSSFIMKCGDQMRQKHITEMMLFFVE